MKLLSPTLVLGLLYFGSVALSQNCVQTALAVIPSCAQNCILNGAPSVGCGGTDFSCQCQKTAALFAAIEDCVAAACPSASYQAVIDGASTVCDCASPVAEVAVYVGTASVSGISSIYHYTVSGSVSAAATATATASATAISSTGTVSGGLGTSSTEGGQGNGATWTGYTSVSPVATASVVGAAAQATPVANVIRYLIPVVAVGAAML